MDIEKRIKMAAESILENEALREGLDDEAASALLDWGMARAKEITATTADVEDDDEAQEAVYPRMRALRQILGDVVSLCAENADPAQRSGLLQEIAEQAPLVYGPAAAIEAGKWANLPLAPGNPAQMIANVRAFIENNTKDSAITKPSTAENTKKKGIQKEQGTPKKRGFFDWLFRR